MMTATSQFEGNADAILAAVAAAVGRGVLAGADAVKTEAQLLCPVDTGALQASLTVSELSEDAGVAEAAVYTEVEYAPYVEFGTGIRGAASPGAGPGPYSPNWPGMVAQPYMRPALDTTTPAVVAAILEEVEGAIR